MNTIDLARRIFIDAYARDDAERHGRKLFEAVQRDLGRRREQSVGSQLRPAMGKSGNLYGQEAKDAKGHGSEKRGSKRSKFAPDSHEEPSAYRRENPAQRAARIKGMKIPADRAAVIKKAMGKKREVLVALNTSEFLREARALARRIRTGCCPCARCANNRVVVNEGRI